MVVGMQRKLGLRTALAPVGAVWCGRRGQRRGREREASQGWLIGKCLLAYTVVCERHLQGARRPDQEGDPRRAQRPGRADPVRALHPARDQARAGLVAAGDLPAPRRPGVGRPGEDEEGWQVQVPPSRHHAARDAHRAVATHPRKGRQMRIYVTSVLVDDQEKALRFYTDVLGFQKKNDIPLGAARWLTVVSPDDPQGTELLLEPDGHPAAGPFRAALVAHGLPATSFAVDDVQAEFQRLRGLGVRFTQEPLEMGAVTTAVFDDTCGNLIQIVKA